MIHLYILAIIFCSNNIFTMEPEQEPHLLVISGYYWRDNKDHVSPYVCKMFPYFKKHKSSIHNATVPLNLSDFGQNQSQNHLEKKIGSDKKTKKLHDNDPLIMYGSSQGTATAINYVAKNSKNIKALVLDSIMLSSNNAIAYTFVGDTTALPDNSICCSVACCINSIGFYLLPYIARLKFKHYSPLGEQPIHNLDALPNDLPIIILHDIKDYHLPYKNGQALYAYLTKIRNNQYVYLFTQENETHFNLLGKDDKERIRAINSILALHKALPYNIKKEYLTSDELKKYQPEVQQEWLDHFNDILKKEKNMPYVLPSVATVCAVVCALSKYFGFI